MESHKTQYKEVCKHVRSLMLGAFPLPKLASPSTTMSASSSRACLRSLRCSRAFSTSTPSRDLVGPPDPVSNLRPVIYDELPMPQAKPGQNTSRALAHRPHPYSLNEFTSTARETTRDDYGAYQLRMKQQELDAFNHAYWTEVCRPTFYQPSSSQ